MAFAPQSRWFASFLRGKWGKLRMLQTLAGILLVLSCLTAILTGIIISNHIFSELWIGIALHRSIFIHQLHIASAYLMVILGGMHIGRHWPELWQRIKNLLLLCLMGLYATIFYYAQKKLQKTHGSEAE